MLLPTKPTPPKTSPTDYTILVYGPPKIGKSTWCSRAPGVVFLATEPGLNSLSTFQVPIGSWPELLEACSELADGKHSFRTVALDTVDLAYKHCCDFVCLTHKVKHPADLKYGKGYGLINSEFQRVLVRLAQLPTGLIMVSHATVREIDDRTGTYTKTMPTLPGKAAEIIKGMADIILYCDIEPEKDGDTVRYRRVMRTKPAQHYEAGDRTGRLAEVMALDYAVFAKAFEIKPKE